MQAVILVGGEGTRLRPLTYDTPKPMVPLFGVPFLERTLGRLRDAGVTEVILAAGYLPSAIHRHLGDGSRIGMRITYVVEASPLGTAGALKNVAEHLHGSFFVLNGDVLTSLDLRAMLAFQQSKGGLGVLHAIRVDDPSAFGCVVRDSDSRITAFVEKPARGDAPTSEVNAGTYLLERRILERIPADRNVSIERETFPSLVAAGERLHSFVTSDYWLDVGRPEQYLQAHRDVLDRKLQLSDSGDALATRGTFWYFDSAQLPRNVKAPSYIGAGVVIDATALVGPYAVLGDDCHIGPRARIRDAVLWDGVAIEADARVSESILAGGVHVGRAASVTAGAVVGSAAQIAAEATLERDARIVAGDEAAAAHA